MKVIHMIFMISILIGSIFLTGCVKTETKYVCANGQTTLVKSECGINKVASIKQKDAEKYAKNYVSGYIGSLGGKSQLVSTYLNPDEGDYHSTFIVTPKNSDPFETIVIVDGDTSQVSCNKNCIYAGDASK